MCSTYTVFHLYRVRFIQHSRMMFIQNCVEKIIGSLNLPKLSGARNNDSPCPKDAHRNAFTFSLAFARTLPFTECLTLTNADSWISLIVEEFSIHTLIDCFFEHTEEIVFINQEFMKCVLIDEFIESIVCINELNGKSLNRWWGSERRHRK